MLLQKQRKKDDSTKKRTKKKQKERKRERKILIFRGRVVRRMKCSQLKKIMRAYLHVVCPQAMSINNVYNA